MEKKNQENLLSKILTSLFIQLERNKQIYCVCGNYKNLPYHTDNDIDIWAKNTLFVTKKVEKICLDNELKLYLKNNNATGTNLFFYSVNEKGPITIHFDILYECRWLSFMPLVRASLIEEQRKKYNNFWVANNTIDTAMHFMYPLANFNKIKDKYKDNFRLYSKNKEFWNIIEKGWGKKFVNNIKHDFMRSNWDIIENKFLQKKKYLVFRAAYKIGYDEIKSLFFFIKTNLIRLFRPNGIFIAFIGPDGCGKTTAQKNLKTFFEKSFTKGKIKRYYWRPFLLPPIKELFFLKKIKKGKNRQKKHYKKIDVNSSMAFERYLQLFKIIYYWFDYIVGRIKYQGAWSRGGVVCFDRYWDDLLVYPERFGIKVPKLYINALGMFIPKPDIIFYFDADANILENRKKEHPITELERQIEEYRNLAKNNNRIFVIDAKLSEKEVVKKVILKCLNKMSLRYL